MEFGGALKFFRLFLLAQTASDIAERRVGEKRLGVDTFGWFFRSRRSLLIFLGFDLCAIFGSKYLGALQIFFGVNVLGFFLLILLTRAFLLGGFGDILTGGLRGGKKGARREKNYGEAKRQRNGRTTHTGRRLHRCRGCEIDSCHGRPTTGGDTA